MSNWNEDTAAMLDAAYERGKAEAQAELREFKNAYYLERAAWNAAMSKGERTTKERDSACMVLALEEASHTATIAKDDALIAKLRERNRALREALWVMFDGGDEPQSYEALKRAERLLTQDEENDR